MKNIQTGEIFAYTIGNTTVNIFQYEVKGQIELTKFVAVHGKGWHKESITAYEYLSLREKIEQAQTNSTDENRPIIHPKMMQLE